MSFKHTKIGDILIIFQDNEKELPTRSTSPWEKKSSYGNAHVWMTEPDEGWCGFPLTTYQDKRWQIWALGEFYGEKTPDLPRALEKSADLNGHFIIFAYEHPEKRWHILTDRFGTLHAYLAGEEKRAALSTFSPAVAEAASTKRLDWDALAGFFTFGFFLGHETYWKDVRILPPATHLVLDDAGQYLAHDPTWTWHHNPNPSMVYEDALKGFANCFETVLKDHVRGKSVALPLSGGLDSRSTLIPLTRPDFKDSANLFPFSYGYTKDSAETRIARQLALKRDLDLHTWTIQPYLFDNIEWIMAAVEGFQDLTLCRQAYVVNDLAQRATHVLAAHWGDVWMDDMGFLGTSTDVSDNLLAQKLIRKFTKHGSDVLLELFKDILPHDMDAQNTTLIEEELRSLCQIQDLDFKVKAWKTQNWSFRWTLTSLRMYQTGVFPLLPFYDHRLTDFFCSVNSEILRGRQLQIDYIKQNASDLAEITWQPYDANLYQSKFYTTWLLPKRALKKLWRLTARKKVIQRNWEVQFLNSRGRTGLEQRLLSKGLKLHNFIPQKKLESFLREFYIRPDAANGYAASMLLTFSAWLEQYG